MGIGLLAVELGNYSKLQQLVFCVIRFSYSLIHS